MTDQPGQPRKTAPPRKRQPKKGQPRPFGKPSADELAQERQRELRAVELALSGLSYSEIAVELGYADKSGSWNAVRRALDRAEQPKVAEYRNLENARLDRLQQAWWTPALEGDEKAAKIVLRIFERRARLNGLDQQAARDAGALADALLGDPQARAERLTALRDELAARRAEKEAAQEAG